MSNPQGTPDPNTSEFRLKAADGEIPGKIPVLILGHNPSQSIASGDVDISEMGDLAYLASAEKMNISSTDANDTLLGTGMRKIRVEGVGNDGAALSEVIEMNGTSNVLTVNSYLRINFLIGLDVDPAGIGWNIGSIKATAETAGTIQEEMDPTQSISQSSHYTVPLGQKLFIHQMELNVARNAGGPNPLVEFKLYYRDGGTGKAWTQYFDKKVDAADSNELDIIPFFPFVLGPRSDLRYRTNTDQNDTETRARVYGLLDVS